MSADKKPRLQKGRKWKSGWISGRLSEHIGQCQIIRRTTLAKNFPCGAGATATLGSDTQLLTQLTHGRHTVFSGFTDFSIGYPVAKADIHRGYSLTLQKLVIIIVIHIQNCKPFVLNLCNGMFQAGSWRVRFWLPVAVTTTLSSIRIPPQPLSLPISSRFRYDPNSPSSRGSSNEGIK